MKSAKNRNQNITPLSPHLSLLANWGGSIPDPEKPDFTLEPAPHSAPIPAPPVAPIPAPPIAPEFMAMFSQAMAAAMTQAITQVAATAAAAAAAPAAPIHGVNGSAHGRPAMTLIDLINEFLLAKARVGRSDRYLRQLRVSLQSFAVNRARTPLPLISTVMIETWLDKSGWKKITQKHYAADVRTLLNYAVNRGYIPNNVGKAVELPDDREDKEIHIHAPADVIKVLEYARRVDLDVMRVLAIRYFAGLRSAETHRLTEEMIKLDMGLIEVPAKISKTRSRRLVTIQPNLKYWLDLGGQIGPIGDMRIRAVIAGSKVAWPSNVARHSFCSYHVAFFKKASETALEAGNSEAMIFKHYRALVTPAAAAEYWAIAPRRLHR